MSKERQIRMDSLRKEIEKLEREWKELEQKELAEIALGPVGCVIEWEDGRGVVQSFDRWCVDQLRYIVRRIKKDGSEGALCSIYPYNHPKLADQPTAAQGDTHD